MNLKNKNIYLNFSSIPNLLSKSRVDKSSKIKKKNFFKIMDLLQKYNFTGFEFPFFRYFTQIEDVKRLKDYLLKNNNKYILDCNKRASVKELKKLIKIARYLKLNFIRIKCSNILSCQRFRYKKKWSEKINKIIKILTTIKPLLKKNNIKIAIENHQDLDSDDLLLIINRIGKKYVGVNFDIGNAYATLEKPLDFFKKTYKHIINIHLKDYIVSKTNNGFKLSRVSTFDGNIDLKNIINYIKQKKINFLYSLEIGSANDRFINVKKKNFFSYFLKKKKKKKNFKEIMINLSKAIDKNRQKKIIKDEIQLLEKSIANISKFKL